MRGRVIRTGCLLLLLLTVAAAAKLTLAENEAEALLGSLPLHCTICAAAGNQSCA